MDLKFSYGRVIYRAFSRQADVLGARVAASEPGFHFRPSLTQSPARDSIILDAALYSTPERAPSVWKLRGQLSSRHKSNRRVRITLKERKTHQRTFVLFHVKAIPQKSAIEAEWCGEIG